MGLGAYRRLLTAYTLNELAWAVGTLALSYLVYRRTGSALGATGFYLCSLFVPALVAPLVVARLDRLPPRTVLPWLYAGEAVAFLVLGLLAHRFRLVPVLALSLADGTLAMTARPLARTATVEVTASAGLLREGNAVTNILFSISYFVGPGIGGAVVAAGGASAALFVNSGLFVAIALTLATCAALPAPPADLDGPKGRLRAGLEYARHHAPVRWLLGVQAASVLFFTISVPVEVVYAQHTLRAGAGGYGALLSAWGGGAVAGSAIYTRWRAASPRALIAFGSGLIGLGLAGMAVAPDLAVAIVASVVAGVGNGVQSVSARTALQEQTEERWMALVMSFNDSLGQAMPGLGILLGGGLTAAAGARVALAVAGAGSLVVTAAVWMVLHPRHGFVRTAAEAP